jgi:integrase
MRPHYLRRFVVCATLTIWLARFPDASADSYLFPRHRVGFAGNSRTPMIWGVDLTRPLGEWKKAWGIACGKVGVRYRWHDLRHTFISRLAENPNVSEETLKALAGHVSKRMLERYSHIRTKAKRAAIAALEQASITTLEDSSQIADRTAFAAFPEEFRHKIGDSH